MLDMRMLEKVKMVTLLQGFTPEELKFFGEYAAERKCLKGERLIVPDEVGSNVYLIIEGSVSIRVEGKELRRLGAGEVVGELGYLDYRPSAAEAVTLTRSTLVMISYKDLDKLQETHPELELKFQRNFATLLSERLRLTTEQVAKSSKMLAFICHDRQKGNLKEFAAHYRGELTSFPLIATAGTAVVLEKELGVKVEKVASTMLRGDIQIAAKVVSGEIMAVFFLRDPFQKTPHDQADTVLHACDLNNVPVASNLASAELLIRGMIALGKDER